ncbi:MAG: DUF748 domain-containing protein, partial [Desulfuromonas sp.]|nr:DUF748 domain-containing protein [Desulfuromonas sp.]
MGKIKKIGIIICIMLLVGVIGGAVLVKMLITPERVKATVIPLAEQQLGRSVTLDSIEISLFSGIVLEGFGIKERDSQEYFIHAERALLRYRFWPLLRLQIEVDEITLQQPQITIVRHRDGTFNFSDLLAVVDQAPAPTPPPTPTAEPTAAQAGAAVAAINLSIANLSLKDGQLNFTDNAVDAPRSHKYAINQLQINARALSLREPFPVKLSCNINGAPLAFSGDLDLMQSSMDAEVTLNKLNVAAFSPYFANAIPGTLRSLALSTNLQVKATPSNIISSGKLTMEDISLTLDALPGASIVDTGFKLEYAAEFKPEAATDNNLSISNLALKDGQLHFIDNAIDTPRSHKYVINQLQINARPMSLREPFPVKLSCNINGAPLALNGEFDLKKSAMNGELSLDKLDIAAFSPYFASSIPGKLSSLALSTKLQVKATPTNIISSGKLNLENISIALDALPDAPIADASFKLDYAAEYKLDAAQVHLSKADMDYNGIKVQLSGAVRALDKDPAVELECVTQNLSMATALAALPPALSSSAAESKPSGALSIRASLKGPISDGAAILRSAGLKLHDLQADAAGFRPHLNGQFIFEKERLHSEDLTLKIGGNVAKMDITARNLFGTPIVMTHNMRAERFDLDAILASAAAPAAASGKTPPAKPGKAPSPTAPEELGPFAIPLTLDGNISIGQALYQGLAITDFSMKYRLQDNILDVTSLSGAISGGTFSQSARVDLRKKGLNYSGKTSLKDLQLDPLVAALAPDSANTLFGAMTLDLDFNGRGTLPENLKQNLNAIGKLKVEKARISGIELTKKLAEFLSLAQLRDIRFDSCVAALDMRNGVAQVDGNFSGTNLRALPKGTIGLDESLNLALNARLAPKLAQELDHKGHIAGFLVDAEGWALLPLKVKGTFSDPRISIDEVALQQQVGKKAIDTLQQRLLDKLAPKQEKPQESIPKSTSEAGAEPEPTQQ